MTCRNIVMVLTGVTVWGGCALVWYGTAWYVMVWNSMGWWVTTMVQHGWACSLATPQTVINSKQDIGWGSKLSHSDICQILYIRIFSKMLYQFQPREKCPVGANTEKLSRAGQLIKDNNLRWSWYYMLAQVYCKYLFTELTRQIYT